MTVEQHCYMRSAPIPVVCGWKQAVNSGFVPSNIFSVLEAKVETHLSSVYFVYVAFLAAFTKAAADAPCTWCWAVLVKMSVCGYVLMCTASAEKLATP